MIANLDKKFNSLVKALSKEKGITREESESAEHTPILPTPPAHQIFNPDGDMGRASKGKTGKLFIPHHPR